MGRLRPILTREHSRDLHDVIEVMRDPRRQQLSQRHHAELGMPPAAIEVCFGESQRRKLAKTYSNVPFPTTQAVRELGVRDRELV